MHDEHEHFSNHPPEHIHGHDDTHEHIQEYIHGGSELKKDLALLTYMLEHNRSHACELEESGGKLLAAGRREAAQLVFDAVHYFEHCNEKLEEAVKMLKEVL